MTQIATVERVFNNGYAEISVPRKSACGHDCEECAGCGMTGAAIRANAKNTPNAKPGQKVVVESSTKQFMGIAVLVYILPIIGFLLGYFLSAGLSEVVRDIIAVISAIVFFLPSIFYDRKQQKNGKLSYTILRIF